MVIVLSPSTAIGIACADAGPGGVPLQLLLLDQPLRNLRRVSYEGNMLQLLPDLSGYSRLQAMNLGDNQLSCLQGLRPLAMLKVLQAPRNFLVSCRGLEGAQAALRAARILKLHAANSSKQQHP